MRFKILGVVIMLASLMILFPQNKANAAEVTRTAKVENVSGTVFVTKGGGIKSLKAYPGMLLQEGDRLTTSAYSNVTIQMVDTDDELLIEENSDFHITDLRIASGKKITRFRVLSGTVWSSVTPLKNKDDVFEIYTPKLEMNVKGTHFITSVDPLSGDARIVVLSGIVAASANTEGRPSSPQPIFPGQAFDFIDPYMSDFEFPTDPDIMKAILQSKNDIDEENRQLLERIDSGGDTNLQPDLNLLNEEAMNRYRENLNQMIGNIVLSAIDSGRATKDEIEALLKNANRETNNPIDLETVKPIELTEVERAKQAEMKRLVEERERLRAEEERKRQQQQNQQAELLRKLQEQRQAVEEQNKKALEEQKRRAEEEFKKQLDEAARAQFEEGQKQIELERARQAEAAEKAKAKAEPPVPTPSPDPGSGPEEPDVQEIQLDYTIGLESLIGELQQVDNAVNYIYYLNGDKIYSSEDIYFEFLDLNLPTIYNLRIDALDRENKIIASTVITFETPKTFDLNLRYEQPGNIIDLYWDRVDLEGLTYSIYLNNVLIATVKEENISSYTIENIGHGNHKIQVTAYFDETPIEIYTYGTIKLSVPMPIPE